jgi:Zn-dependent M32 family carboxypeptidase
MTLRKVPSKAPWSKIVVDLGGEPPVSLRPKAHSSWPLDGTPLGRGVSAGIHESQSRLWENVIGRSRGFWEHFYPSLQGVFPEQLGSVPITAFHPAINKVARSIIRTEADDLLS